MAAPAHGLGQRDRCEPQRLGGRARGIQASGGRVSGGRSGNECETLLGETTLAGVTTANGIPRTVAAGECCRQAPAQPAWRQHSGCASLSSVGTEPASFGGCESSDAGAAWSPWQGGSALVEASAETTPRPLSTRLMLSTQRISMDQRDIAVDYRRALSRSRRPLITVGIRPGRPDRRPGNRASSRGTRRAAPTPYRASPVPRCSTGSRSPPGCL